METGGPTAIESILWVLAASAVLTLSAFGLAVLLRRSCEEGIRQIGGQIEEHADRLNQIAGFLQIYAGIDQEPFSEPLDALQAEASDLENQLQEFLVSCRFYEERVLASVENRFLAIASAPARWLLLWRQLIGLRRESREIAGRLSAAEDQVERINEIPWELAEQSRQTEKDLAELAQTARYLQQEGAGGSALRTVISQLPVLQRGLDQIPRSYLEADRERLSATANLDTTIRVYEALNRIQPALARYLPQVREWNDYFQKTAEDYEVLKQSGANLRQLIANPPRGLDIAPIESRLDQIARMAVELGQQVAQPDVEQLKTLSREINHLQKVIQDTEHQFNRASLQANELGQSVTELEIGLEALSQQCDTLMHSKVYPLDWNESKSLLASLRKRLGAIGPAYKLRTPEQLVHDLKEVEAIRREQALLAEKIPQAAEQYRALTALMNSPEIQGGLSWLDESSQMLAQVEVYDPKNWPKRDSLQTLPGELEALKDLHNRLIPQDPAVPLKESELAERLQEAQQLYSQHKALRPRVESVRSRLEEVIALEKEGKEKLTASWTALERVSLLADTNDLIDSAAGKEIEQLANEIRQLGNDLNAQAYGEIEKKIQKINVQAEKVIQALNRWLGQLDAAIGERARQVSERLAQLDAITSLEDTPIQEARSLLAREALISAEPEPPARGSVKTAPRSAVGRLTARVAAAGSAAAEAARGAAARLSPGDHKPAVSELEATAEIKRKNDLWLTLQAVQKALDEGSQPLLDAYEEMVKARNETRDSLAEVAKRTPEKRSWPPTNQSPLSESQLLGPADGRLEALKRQRGRSEWAMVELGRLAQQYRFIAERARQVLHRINQDHERVQELEWQIAEVKRRWQAQAQASPGNSVMRENVQQVISQADSQLTYIKQQYLRGALSYEQTVQNMQLLYDQIFTARVSIDSQNDIGLNETYPSSG